MRFFDVQDWSRGRPLHFFVGGKQKWRWWANEFLALQRICNKLRFFIELKKKEEIFLLTLTIRVQSRAPALLFGRRWIRSNGHLLMTHGCCTQMLTRLKVMDAPIGRCSCAFFSALEVKGCGDLSRGWQLIFKVSSFRALQLFGKFVFNSFLNTYLFSSVRVSSNHGAFITGVAHGNIFFFFFSKKKIQFEPKMD